MKLILTFVAVLAFCFAIVVVLYQADSPDISSSIHGRGEVIISAIETGRVEAGCPEGSKFLGTMRSLGMDSRSWPIGDGPVDYGRMAVCGAY